MGIEQDVRPGITGESAEKKSLSRRISNKIADAIASRTGPKIRTWTENVGEATEIEYPPMLDQKIYEALKDGCILVFVANHGSQYDAAVFAYVLEDLSERLANDREDFPEVIDLQSLLPLAKSMITGDQGLLASITYKATSPLLIGHGLQPVPTATKKDVGKRHVRPNPLEFKHNLDGAINQGSLAIANLAAANVDEGRRGKNGQLNGMQPFAEDSLRIYHKLAQKHNRPVAFIPVSIRGSREVLNPSTRLPGIRAIRAGFKHGDPVTVSAYIGLPMRSDRNGELKEFIEAGNWHEAERLIGKAIAQHLPPEQLGDYGRKLLNR